MTISLCLLSAGSVMAQPKPTTSPQQPTPSSTTSIRLEKELEKTQFENIRSEAYKIAREQVDQRIDQAFGRLSTALTILSLVAALVLWAFRQSIMRDLENQLKKQFKEQIDENLKHVVEAQLENGVRSEFNNQKEAFSKDFEELMLDCSIKKEEILHGLSVILPSIQETLSFEESQSTPKRQQELQKFTSQLNLLSAIPQLFTAEDHIKQGQAFYFESRYDDALASYEKAAQMKPDYLDAWFGKGKALRRLRRYKEAVIAHEKVIQIDPNHYSAWVERGSALRWSKQPKEAILSCEKAIEIKPDYARAWYNKACYLSLEIEIELAVESLKEASKLTPDGKYRTMAQTDSDFDSIRDDERFKKLLNI
ncbi:tetratricopeptide repeat protein [Phormidesmis sp. 146-35]